MADSSRSKLIAFEASALHGWRTSGPKAVFGLVFRVRYRTLGDVTVGVLEHDFIELSINGFYHGLLRPSGTVDLGLAKTCAPASMSYVGDLDEHALELIRRLREKAGFLEFRLFVSGTVDNGGTRHAIEEEITYAVADAEWAGCLKQLGHSRA